MGVLLFGVGLVGSLLVVFKVVGLLDERFLDGGR